MTAEELMGHKSATFQLLPTVFPRKITCPRRIYFPTQEINIADYQIVRC